MKKTKVLFLSANPEDTSILRIDNEVRAISEKIRLSDHRDVIEFISNWAVRPDDLLQGLNEHKPQILHFSGHGNTKGEILLADNNNQIKAVDAIALKALLITLKDNLKVIVLNACYSKRQADVIVETVDCVIGMNSSIGDTAAIVFAASFYRAIGFGRSVKDAFDQGIVSLLLEGIPEEKTPELLCKKNIDPSKIFLLEKNNKPNHKKKKETDSSRSTSREILQKGKKNLYLENNNGTINIED